MAKALFLLAVFFLFYPRLALTAGLSQRLAGRILLDVERQGQAWYVNPADLKRYYLGRPADAFAIMRQLGLGISEADFQKIPQAGMKVSGDKKLSQRLAGRILLRVSHYGEAWYLNPVNLKKYYLGRPADAFAIMRQLGLGISRENLAKIHKPGLYESLSQFSHYEHKKIKTQAGVFSIDLVEIDLTDPNLEILTLTAQDKDCEHNCPAYSLAHFVLNHNGFAGINGTYFCASSGCGASNYYFYPVYNSCSGVFVNASQLKYWTTGPIIAFDKNNKFYYFKDSREFPVLNWFKQSQVSLKQAFQQAYGAELQAAIGNKPRLIQAGANYLINWELDKKQKEQKTRRAAIGYKNNRIYLVVAHRATLPDLALVMKALAVDYALNLDGGASAALWYNDEYMVGPGRNIPNAIVFRQKNVK